MGSLWLESSNHHMCHSWPGTADNCVAKAPDLTTRICLFDYDLYGEFRAIYCIAMLEIQTISNHRSHFCIFYGSLCSSMLLCFLLILCWTRMDTNIVLLYEYCADLTSYYVWTSLYIGIVIWNIIFMSVWTN
jgi:hypothetical protein